ncbi:hypothetical protein GCM10022631_11140 [Deinococcus rubellus]|uniref:hypothetical protein n=1 Tax=Deinococcus rubellus TaxID=1889240 RepID=UPI0031F06881
MSGVSWRVLALIVVLLLPFGQAGRSGGGFGGRARTSVSTRVTRTPSVRISSRRVSPARPQPTTRVTPRVQVRPPLSVTHVVVLSPPPVWVQASPAQPSRPSQLIPLLIALVLLGVLAWVVWNDSHDP